MLQWTIGLQQQRRRRLLMLKVAAEHTVPVQVCVCINRGRREGEGVSRRSSFFGAQVMPVSLTLPQVQSSAERSSGKKNRFS